jgi:sigma-B regulation protein RsbU (phosphoserine phosphatase)
MNSELVLASDIQKSLMPPLTMNWQGGEVSCFFKPTLEIGGDFYGYHFFDQGRFALAVGDVSGHGIPAALLMAATLSLFDSSFERDLNPCERLSLLDQELVSYCEQRSQNCAFCYLELSGHNVYFANAGGIPPFIRKNSGEIQWQKVCGVPLGHGLGSELGYVGIQVPVEDGDFIVMLSDGAVEAKGSQHNMLGFERLEKVIAGAPDGSAQAMLEHIVQEVLGYADERFPQDDFTIAVMRLISEPSQLSSPLEIGQVGSNLSN